MNCATKYRVTIIFMIMQLCSAFLYAGNTPCNSTNLDPFTPVFDYYDNSGNSDSGVIPPPYGGYTGSDIWFSFTMPAGGVNLIIEAVGMVDPAVAIYEGPCTGPKLLYNVLDDNCTGGVSPAMSLTDLIPGQEYFIRIWGQDGTPNGSFGIFLSNTMAEEPGFILHSAATEQGDCIVLTPSATGQQGCAWFEIPMDFNQPFVNTMTANFGSNDISGADGITLVYQANGPNYCGGTGQGIGAEGMPNSAIFEFDTFQNGNLGDPYDDHTSFNVNGNMNHANSVNGPVTLGNIEDGADHSIEFHYDGASNYELYFDGVLVLSGSYDFINNCFGGATTAWWGYTASTGAAVNTHTICPEVEEFIIGTQEYQEFEICEGESINGYSESGFYVDYTEGSGGCLHQINTLVTVRPVPETVYLDTTICEGDIILIGGVALFQEGEHPITTNTVFGCDSNIVVDLTILDVEVDIPAVPELNCDITEILLTSNIESNHPEAIFNYLWSGPNGYGSFPEFLINSSGTYQLEIEMILNGIGCWATGSTYVGIDTISPILHGLQDYELTCDEQNNPSEIDVSGSIPSDSVTFSWTYNGLHVGNSSIQEIIGVGTHYVVMTDLTNGCSTEGFSVVTGADDRPQVDIEGDILNCETDSFQFITSLNQTDLNLRWTKDGEFYSSDTEPNVFLPGVYEIFVSNSEGCKDSAQYIVEIDTIPPDVILDPKILACNTDSISIPLTLNPDHHFTWNSSQNFRLDSAAIVIYEGGQYILNSENPINKCTSNDTLFVSDLGDSPIISINADTLTCQMPNLELDVNSDQNGVSYQWFINGLFLSNYEDPRVYAPGTYYMEATSLTGCKTIDSINVSIDTLHPNVALNPPDTIECDNKQIELQGITENTDMIQWTGPSNFTSDTSFPIVNLPGIYQYTATFDRNGCTFTDSIEVFSNVVIPIFDLQSDTLNCFDPTKEISFEITSDFDSLLWIGPNGFISKETSPTINSEGIYELHIDMPGNCDVDTSVVISGDFIVPDFNILSEDIHCDNLNPPLSVLNYQNYNSIQWITPNGSSNDTFINAEGAGYYYAIVIGKNGCSKIDSVLIQEFLESPQVSIDKSNDITCDNMEVGLFVGSTDSIDLIEWDVFGEKVSDPEVIIDQGGTFEVIVTNQYGCQTKESIEVLTFLDKPELTLKGNDLDCILTQSTLSAQSNNTLRDFEWVSVPNEYDGPVNTQVIETEIEGKYVFAGTNEYGCSDTIEFEIIKYDIYPEINLLSPDTILVDPDKLDAFIETEVRGENLEFEWFPSVGISCDNCPSPEILEDYQSEYNLVVTNEYGCTEEIMVYIREIEKPAQVYAPNIISINGDNNNDRFTIYGTSKTIIDIDLLTIYDRWGNLVFTQQNFPINDPSYGWDGSLNGQKGRQGVFVYMAKIQLKNGDIIQISGDITVIR